MGAAVDIILHFPTEEDASLGREVTLDMMKVYTMTEPDVFDDPDNDAQTDALLFYRIHRKRVKCFQEDEWAFRCHTNTSFKRLICRGTTVALEQCADFQDWIGSVSEDRRGEFFYTLCLANATEHPQTPFEAVYRYEMTVSGSVEKIWCTYDGTSLHLERLCGEIPFDENDRTGAETADWNIQKLRKYLDRHILSFDQEKVIIKDGILKNCFGSQEHIVVPDEVTEIGEWAFEFCDHLRTVVLPKGLKRIDDCAFAGCDCLESIAIPEGVTEIGREAFCGCERLQSVVFPESLQKIGALAFKKCPSLHCVRIPESVKEIGDFAFGYIGVNRREETGEFWIIGGDESAAHIYARVNGFYIEGFDGEELY